jgi:hypothetical protein
LRESCSRAGDVACCVGQTIRNNGCQPSQHSGQWRCSRSADLPLGLASAGHPQVIAARSGHRTRFVRSAVLAIFAVNALSESCVNRSESNRGARVHGLATMRPSEGKAGLSAGRL